MNLRGISSLVRVNDALLAVITLVIAAFVILALRYLFHSGRWSGVLSTQPFYDPRTFEGRVRLGISRRAAATQLPL